MTVAQKPKRLKLKHGVHANYLENVLTKDITALESIFELIDNAVDAARDQLFKDPHLELDKYGLPARYDGFKIDIRFGKNSVIFSDNCAGIPKNVLTHRAFMIGAMSDHPFGIGRFGIGLKRALFKLGTRYRLLTDTGEFRAAMSFSDEDLIAPNKEIFASQRMSLGKPMTIIRISELRDRVRHEFAGDSWRERFSTVLSRRYGRYVTKGLKILVEGEPIASFGPGFRSFKSLKPVSDSATASNEVTIFIESGMHARYRVKGEDDYVKSDVGALTDEFGWYFVCNDRIVEIATHTAALGWSTRWHQEYYGFVGWVYFVAEDPAHLPWDTKKTTIDPYSPAFREIADRLQAFAEDYKAKNKQIKSPTSTKANRPEVRAANGEKNAAAAAVKPERSATKPNGRPTSGSNIHNEHWTSLLPSMNISVTNNKLASLIAEAEGLSVEMCYSGTLLFRSLMEIALFEHLKRTRSLGAVKQMHYSAQENSGRPMDEAKKRKYRPDFRTALEWLNRNDEYFPSDVRRDCTFARNKFSKHLQEMNGLVHENDLTNSSKLASIRDDTLPLLRFLLTEK